MVITNIQPEEMCPGVVRKHFIDRATGAGSISMGLVTLQPHSALPLHRHRIEDVMIVLEGEGVLVEDGVETKVTVGMGMIAPGNTVHTIRNDSDAPFTIVYAWPGVEVERFPVK